MSTGIGLVAVWLVVLAAWYWWARVRSLSLRDEWNPDKWRRCKPCKDKLIRTTPEGLEPHLGHYLGPARFMHTNEYIRVVMGLL